MPNWSRALLTLGEGLGNVAQSVAQREIESMRAMRDENMMRLGANLREQENVAEFGRRKELIGMEDTAATQRIGQQQAFEVGQTVRREQHDVTMAGRQESFQRERFGREDLQTAERTYAAQTSAIDERLAEISDEMIKARAEASTSMTEIDPAIFEPWQTEIKQLQQQKRLVGKQRDIHLAQLGDKRYAKVTPEEVAAEAKLRSPGPGTRRGPRSEQPSAAQATAPRAAPKEDVPVAPPKPQGMIDRQQRRERRVAPGDLERRGARPPSDSGPNILQQAFRRGAKASKSYEQDSQAARAWLRAKRDGRQPSAEVVQRVNAMSAQRRAALGITE